MYTKVINVNWNIPRNVVRVKAFLLNDNNEFLLGKCGGGYQLPGGHAEINEDYKTTLIREIKEETGITLNLDNNVKPYYSICYKTNKTEFTSQVVYFFIRCNEKPNLSKTNYTKEELDGNFSLEYINADNFLNIINQNKEEDIAPIYKVIDDEIIDAYSNLKF